MYFLTNSILFQHFSMYFLTNSFNLHTLKNYTKKTDFKIFPTAVMVVEHLEISIIFV